jgi:hypothetical protein
MRNVFHVNNFFHILQFHGSFVFGFGANFVSLQFILTVQLREACPSVIRQLQVFFGTIVAIP